MDTSLCNNLRFTHLLHCVSLAIFLHFNFPNLPETSFSNHIMEDKVNFTKIAVDFALFFLITVMSSYFFLDWFLFLYQLHKLLKLIIRLIENFLLLRGWLFLFFFLILLDLYGLRIFRIEIIILLHQRSISSVSLSSRVLLQIWIILFESIFLDHWSIGDWTWISFVDILWTLSRGIPSVRFLARSPALR